MVVDGHCFLILVSRFGCLVVIGRSDVCCWLVMWVRVVAIG